MAEEVVCLSTFVMMFIGMAAFAYLLYRFTTFVRLTDLTDAEYAVLKDAQFVSLCRPTCRVKPDGAVLFRKNPLSYNRVFRNGFFTDIATVDEMPSHSWGSMIGPRWAMRMKPGFIPFTDISGIFSLDVSMRTLRAGKQLENSHETAGIQIEMKDLRTVVLLGEWVQRRLVPALKEAMGRSWEGLYHPDERLTGLLVAHRWSNGKSSHYDNFSYIDYAKHKLIRSGPDYASNRFEGLRADGRNHHDLKVELPHWLLWRTGEDYYFRVSHDIPGAERSASLSTSV